MPKDDWRNRRSPLKRIKNISSLSLVKVSLVELQLNVSIHYEFARFSPAIAASSFFDSPVFTLFYFFSSFNSSYVYVESLEAGEARFSSREGGREEGSGKSPGMWRFASNLFVLWSGIQEPFFLCPRSYHPSDPTYARPHISPFKNPPSSNQLYHFNEQTNLELSRITSLKLYPVK